MNESWFAGFINALYHRRRYLDTCIRKTIRKRENMFETIEEGMKYLKEVVVQREKYKSLYLFDRGCQIYVQLVQLGANPKEVLDVVLP